MEEQKVRTVSIGRGPVASLVKRSLGISKHRAGTMDVKNGYEYVPGTASGARNKATSRSKADVKAENRARNKRAKASRRRNRG